MSDSDEASARNRLGLLPDASERALLQVLLDNSHTRVKFKTICDKRVDLFGSPASDLRRKVQKRRQYFLARPEKFNQALAVLFGDKVVPADSIVVPAEEVSGAPTSSTDHSEFVPNIASPPRRPRRIAISASPNPKRIMATKSEDSSSIPKHQLSFDAPWENPFGILCVVGKSVEKDNTVFDKVTVMKPIF
jgi:hypothetical protein